MNYQTLKQKRNDLILEFHDSNLQKKDILCIEDYDKLLRFIDEYEDLTCQMLQYIKEKETPVTRSNLWEDTVGIEINDQEDRKWLEHYLSLGE